VTSERRELSPSVKHIAGRVVPAVFFILILIAGAHLLSQSPSKTGGQKAPAVSKASEAPSPAPEVDVEQAASQLLDELAAQKENSEVVAEVYGEPIRAGEVKERLEEVRKTNPEASAPEVTEQLVEERLLIHEAEKESIKVAEKEVQEVYDYYVSINPGIKELPEAEVKERIEEQLKISRLLEEKLRLSEINVTDEEVEEYLEENREAFDVLLEEDPALLEPLKERIRSSIYKAKVRKAYEDYIAGLKEAGGVVQ